MIVNLPLSPPTPLQRINSNFIMAEKQLHAIMVSFSFQGHITPFVNLALKLASNGCTITFVHSEYTHHMLSKSQNITNEETSPNFFSKSGLDIHYRTIYDGFPVEFDRFANMDEYFESIFNDFPTRVDELVGEIIQDDHDSSLVPFLVTDTFYAWPASVAKKYNMMNVSFWTEPALVFSINYHLDLLRENGHFPSKGNHENQIDYIPGVDSISSKDLMSYLQDNDTTTIVHKVVFKAFEQVKFADFVLINTVNELECNILSALNQTIPTFAIGPLNFTTSVVPKSLWSQSDCTQWLNTKPPRSVLYISFGSIVASNREFAEEIAHGLFVSKVDFIWIVRECMDVLPEGLKNEMGGRGLIVSWCDQNVVLSNPAIGGFLTHCGWNSILESVWWGVPMICFPFFVDQVTNRKLVVKDWKIGINLCDGVDVTREEVTEKIKSMMNGETSKGMRNEIGKLRNVLRDALGEDGSTVRNLDQFLKELKAKDHAM